MHNLIFMAMVFAFAISSFAQTYSRSTFLKAYLGLYKGIADNSVIFVSTSGSNLEKPMFYLPLLDKNVSEYLKTELGGKLNYLYEVYVLEEGTENPADYGYKAEIDLKCKIADWHWIAKTAVFAIQRGI